MRARLESCLLGLLLWPGCSTEQLGAYQENEASDAQGRAPRLGSDTRSETPSMGGSAERGGGAPSLAEFAETSEQAIAFSALSDAVTLELGVTPARPYYQPGQMLQLLPVARDAQGQRVFGRFQYTPSPLQAVGRTHGMPGRFELIEEGTISFEVCAHARLCRSVSVVVDAGSPLIVVESPAAGAQLGGDGGESILVRGSVADARQSWVWVDGQPVEVDALGRFEATLAASFGVNHIFVSASDGVSNEAQDRRDVLWAPSYLPVATSPVPQGVKAVLPSGVRLALGQSFFDDGVRPAASAKPQTKDLADLVALVVERAQLTSKLADPLLRSGDTLLLRVTDLRPRDVSVEVAILDGALELFVRVARLEIDTQGGVDLAGAMVSLDGGMNATLALLAKLNVGVGAAGGVEVSLSESHTLLESVSTRFNEPEANAVFRLAEGSLRAVVEDALSGAVADVLVQQLPSVLQNALGSVEQLLRDKRFTLSFAPLPAQTLVIDGRVAAAKAAHGRHVKLDLEAEVGTETAPLRTGSRGAPQRSATPVVETFDGRSMQLALRMDFVNLLLHTLWNGGLLELRGAGAQNSGELSDLLEAVTISGKLPPVFRAAHAWEQADAIIELGQLEVLFELGESSRYGATALLPVDVDLREGALRLELGLPQLDLWLIDSTAETPTPGEELAALLVPLLLPALEDALNGNPVALDLPSFEVGELTALAPSLAGLRLSLSPGDDVVVRGDALIIDLQLNGAVP